MISLSKSMADLVAVVIALTNPKTAPVATVNAVNRLIANAASLPNASSSVAASESALAFCLAA